MNGPAFYEANGARLAVWEQPGEGTPILFAHATSFHARCWNRVVERLPGRHCYAVDMRGHGESSKPEPPYLWSSFGGDIASLAHQMGLRGVIGTGHSMGAHSLVSASIQDPGLFSRLVLLDPVIMPRPFYRAEPGEPHFARRRRARWQSPREMIERFQDRPPFVSWDPAVLEDYCNYGLVPAPDGDGFVLACPPEVEGSIYENSGLPDANLLDRLGEVRIEVTVARAAVSMSARGATFDMAASPTVQDLAGYFANGRDIQTAQSHFIPMENPGLVAELLLG